MEKLWYKTLFSVSPRLIPFHKGNAHNAVQVKSVDIVPDPPLPGQELTVKVVVNILKPVEVRRPNADNHLLSPSI